MHLHFAAAHRRAVREDNERAWLAYHIAALLKTTKRIPLKQLLAKDAGRKLTLDEQLSRLRAWVVATGGKIVPPKTD